MTNQSVEAVGESVQAQPGLRPFPLTQANHVLRKPLMPDTPITNLERSLSAELSNGDVEVLSNQPHWVSLRIACRIETAIQVAELLRELVADLGPMEGEKLAIAVRELLLNAVEHGGHLDPEKTADVSYIRTARSVVCHICDPGEGFSWNDLGHSVVSALEKPFRHLDLRAQTGIRPGGFGLLIAKRVANELLYNAKGNEVIFIRYL